MLAQQNKLPIDAYQDLSADNEYSFHYGLAPDERSVESDNGGSYVLKDSEYGDFAASGVDVADYIRYKRLTGVVEDLRPGLPDLALSDGVIVAMQAKSATLLDAMRLAARDQQGEFATEDIRHAMRDVYFLYSSMALVLGAHSSQVGIEKNGTFAYPISHRHLNKGRYESIVAVRSETLSDEGDFVDVDGFDRDIGFQDGFPYKGILKITIEA